MNKTREEESRLARTSLEQLYSPYEGTSHPLSYHIHVRTYNNPSSSAYCYNAAEMRYLLEGAQAALEKHYSFSTPHFSFFNGTDRVSRATRDPLLHHRSSFASSSTKGEPVTTDSIEQPQHYNTATARAIEHQLGIYSNGSLVPLTSWQRLWYNNREHWLHEKIKEARKKAAEVVEELERFKCPDRTLKDIAIIRSFIAEHVSIAFRGALRRKFEEHEFLTPESINPLLWIIGWMVQLGAIAFCLYWVLAWGITNTGSTLNHWSNSYVAAACQDIFLFETTKMGFMFVFTLVSVRPQLSAIRQVINEAALSYIQYGPPTHRTENDIVIVQHFSPTCRAASMGKVKTLAAAAILRQINDADYEKCLHHRSYTLSSVVFSFMFAMAFFGMIHEELEDAAMDPVVNAIWTGIFVAFSQISTYSPTTVIVLVLVGCSLYFYYTLLYPDVMKTARNVRRADIHFHHVRRGSHQHYEHQRHLRQAHHLPWNQRVMHECRRSYASLRARVIYYWSLLQFMCTSEYWTYAPIQRSQDDALWMEVNRFAVLNSANVAGGASITDEGPRKTTHHPVDKPPKMHLPRAFVGDIDAMEGESLSPRKAAEMLIHRIPNEIMAMRPSGIHTTPISS